MTLTDCRRSVGGSAVVSGLVTGVGGLSSDGATSTDCVNLSSLNVFPRMAAAAALVACAVAAWVLPTQAGSSPERRALNQAAAQPAGVPGVWRLVFDSEFNGSRLPTDWRTGWFGGGVTAPVRATELACYSPANVVFPGDGTMHLNVTAQPSTCGGISRPFSGAIVTTNPNDGRSAGGFQYTYGLLEARVYLPAVGRGVADWPAVWTDGQNWPSDGEDDVMEGLNGRLCFHFHDQQGARGGCVVRFKPGWHTFASDWSPGSVVYYYDGVRVGEVSEGVTGAPMYIVLDNTVRAGEQALTAVDSVRVKYVRVWQQG